MIDALYTRVSDIALYTGTNLVKSEFLPDVKQPSIIAIYYELFKEIYDKDEVIPLLYKINILNNHFRLHHISDVQTKY